MSSMIIFADPWMTTALAVPVADFGKNGGPPNENRIGCILHEIQIWKCKVQASCFVCDSSFCDDRRMTGHSAITDVEMQWRVWAGSGQSLKQFS